MINKEQIICEISSKKIIAIARGIYGEQCINLAKALYDGGISLLEITYDQSNSQSVQDTADTLRALNSALGDKMMFGAGTVISAQQVTVAVDAGAKIIGVNNRDLRDLTVDMNNSIRLRRMAPADTVFVSESGIKTADDIKSLRDNNVDAVLIGETLMRSSDKKAALQQLNGGPL